MKYRVKSCLQALYHMIRIYQEQKILILSSTNMDNGEKDSVSRYIRRAESASSIQKNIDIPK